MKIAITGSTGFLGTALVADLRTDGHEVLRLVRHPPQAVDEVRWDPRAADAGLGDPEPLSGIDACVHLAGAGVANRRWTARYKAEVKASRVLSTRALAGVLAKLTPQPRVFVCASAIGWYGENSGVDETAPAGQGFLAGLVREWEAAADPARDAGIRVVHTRSGLVMGRDGGILARFVPLARFGVCPRLGPGTQVMSWISKPDEIAALRFVLDREDLSGPVNLTAPEPATNSEFTAALNAAMNRPYLPWLRVPAWLLRLAIGEASVELLTSSQVTPRRLLEAGYEFRHPAIREALAAELTRT